MTSDEGRQDEPGYGLVMPFVTVASKGGPHDDDAYTAGWEMGLLDAQLDCYGYGPDCVEATIHAVNRDQADLIAMRHGYRMNVTSEDDEWVTADFQRPLDGNARGADRLDPS